MSEIGSINYINQVDLAWLAGILEGEGSFYVENDRPYIKVSMVDEDIIWRVYDLVGAGHIGVENRKDPNQQTCFRWRTQGHYAMQLMPLLLPYMGYRRSARIEELLERYKDVKYRTIHTPRTRRINRDAWLARVAEKDLTSGSNDGIMYTYSERRDIHARKTTAF